MIISITPGTFLRISRECPIFREDHRDAFKYVSSGGLSVQLSDSNPFGRVPVDQTCEETVNKDTQTSGGTKGFSLKLNASKYYLVAEYQSTFLR